MYAYWLLNSNKRATSMQDVNNRETEEGIDGNPILLAQFSVKLKLL